MNLGDVNTDAQSETLPAEAFSSHAGSSSSYTPDAANRRHFTNKALEVLNDLRVAGQLCDGVLRVGETSFPVHRNILSASSAFFKAVFTSVGAGGGGGGAGVGQEGGSRSREPQVVVLNDVGEDTLRLLIEFAYGQTVFLHDGNVLDVFNIADRFMMPSLAKECCQFLKDELCAENCLGMASFARAYFRTGLARAAIHFAHSNFALLVSESQEFLELSADSLHEFLSSDELNVRHEELVFEAICRWIQHDPVTRKREMARMLTTVRLGFLSSEYLMERIKAHEYVCENEDAKQIVIEALKRVCKLETKDLSKAHSSFLMFKPRVPYEILFVIGGWSGGSPTNLIETYDSRADQWLVCREPDHEPRAYHGCVTLGQVIYVMGGFNGLEYFNSCRKFYPKILRWEEAPPMNSKRCYVSAVGLGGKVYVMGGFDGHTRLNSVERLDPATNQWTHVMPMNQQRSDAKASVLNGKIYICGGFNGQECLNTAEYYDSETGQWTMISPMRNRRSGVGVIAYHGCVYALGGFNGITRMNTAERFDPSTQTWATLPEMYSPRSNFAVGVIDDLLFTIGGFNGVTTISHVECYDDVTNEWFDTATLSLNRSALCACVVEDLPNVQEFTFKPKPPPTKRRRSHTSNSKKHHPSDPSSSSHHDSMMLQQSQSGQAGPSDVLSQLA